MMLVKSLITDNMPTVLGMTHVGEEDWGNLTCCHSVSIAESSFGLITGSVIYFVQGDYIPYVSGLLVNTGNIILRKWGRSKMRCSCIWNVFRPVGALQSSMSCLPLAVVDLDTLSTLLLTPLVFGKGWTFLIEGPWSGKVSNPATIQQAWCMPDCHIKCLPAV